MAAATVLGNPLTLTKNSSSPPLSLLHTNGYYHHKRYKFTYSPRSPKMAPIRRPTCMTLVAAPVLNGVQCIMQEKSTMVDLTALVKMKFSKAGSLKELIRRSVEAATSSVEGGVVLQLVSKDVDPETKKGKLSEEAVLHWSSSSKAEAEHQTYEVNFKIDPNFGLPGAIYVHSRHQDEFFLMSVSIEGIVHFACRSWIQPVTVDSGTRVFFCDKACLPSQTPSGLVELRQRELKDLRGDGKGLRLPSDRIYDYDVYNDLGNPDKGTNYARPTLGGGNNPYPRRCRSGRPPTTTDVSAESPSSPSLPAYVPRDEEYGEQKKEFMSHGRKNAILRNIVPLLIAKIFGEKNFYVAVDADNQHKNKSKMTIMSLDKLLNKNPILKILSNVQEVIERTFNLDPPKYISKDAIWGLPDDEFGRRVLAGVNPVSIEKLKVFPPVSKLDPSIYGPQESALKEEHIISLLEGMSVQQAMDEDKLFILDYHDIYLPYVDRINSIEGRKTYATRTIFFLTPYGTLKPIAIELSLPLAEQKASSKLVLTPPTNGTAYWLWQLAKEHVCSNDAAIQTLINHWLRIHACMEPFFVAAHRSLSVMHPIFKLLDPHMRYIMKTNSFSRDVLINAGGVIETFNAPAKYCMEFSCSAYQDWWRFDLEGLPADLIRRGMAVPDSTYPFGLRLTIDDYPYAQDGLLIWSAIENLVTKYVNHYYPEAIIVQDDTELQAWYNESVNKGHADLRNAAWWPKLSTPKDLINILTTIIWTVTGQHAVMNFGQHPYGGYIPARPPFMRRLLPSENDPDYEHFLANPQEYFVSSLPSFTQAAQFAAVLHTGSGHSPDEEYIGERNDLSSWASEPEILEAFYEFLLDTKAIVQEISRRNSDPRLRNRCGEGTFPFELLIPSSGSGTTSRGVPNSVTA
ncbi:linoleate 13S-lipoxygenase 3-1, chloroplastic-like [Sesamum indicum]|uniref:Lipoxygenase n=1 Tax=Sesamum indicum TaxID=4182 RepID=A0A6I9T807_SESIN|nr:linoleate 13S-lipoxygenase 3-1, chloroplastic-like [Sesamum indicum]